MNTNALIAKVTERRRSIQEMVRRRDDLTRQIEVRQVELRAYEDALALVNAEEEPQRPQTESDEHKETSGYAAARMSDLWRAVFEAMRQRKPQTISIPDIKDIAASRNFETNDQSIRSSLHKFTARGWLDRVTIGNYTITEAGERALDVRASRAGELLSKIEDVAGASAMLLRPPN